MILVRITKQIQLNYENYFYFKYIFEKNKLKLTPNYFDNYIKIRSYKLNVKF